LGIVRDLLRRHGGGLEVTGKEGGKAVVALLVGVPE